MEEDEDCDGVITEDDCDDSDFNSIAIAEDGDCDGVLTIDDCDDSDSNMVSMIVDLECDGFYLADNDITILCSTPLVNTSGYVDGVLYTKRDRNYLNNLSHSSTEWEVICTSDVTDMGYMFRETSSFNQDLSGWCVDNFSSEPANFSSGANSWIEPQPSWGLCPQSDLVHSAFKLDYSNNEAA